MESESSEDGKIRTKQENVSDAKMKNSTEVKSLSASPIPVIEPVPRPPTPMSTKFGVEAIEMKERRRKRRRRCTKCCGEPPSQGDSEPVRQGCGNHCCSHENGEIRMRGGSDTDRSVNKISGKKLRLRSSSEDPSGFRRQRNHCCGHSSRISIFEDLDVTRFNSGYVSQLYNLPIQEERARGGCGSCGGSGQQSSPASYRAALILKKIEFPCERPSSSVGAGGGGGGGGCSGANAEVQGGCPCGGCGGPACSENPGGGGAGGGCCKTSRPRGNPCKCKCQSCDAPHPAGGCGGQSCGMMYSCSGSSAGRCCFPRNTKRRSGPECCGGGDPSCGGCC